MTDITVIFPTRHLIQNNWFPRVQVFILDAPMRLRRCMAQILFNFSCHKSLYTYVPSRPMFNVSSLHFHTLLPFISISIFFVFMWACRSVSLSCLSPLLLLTFITIYILSIQSHRPPQFLPAPSRAAHDAADRAHAAAGGARVALRHCTRHLANAQVSVCRSETIGCRGFGHHRHQQ